MARPLSWNSFFKRVGRTFFYYTDPFSIYRLFNRQMDVKNDYRPYVFGKGYLVFFYILVEGNNIYIFNANGKTSWYRKALYDVKHKRTLAKLYKEYGDRVGAPCGSGHGHSTVKEEDAVDIKYDSPKNIYKTAKLFKVSPTTVSFIRSGKRWGYL